MNRATIFWSIALLVLTIGLQTPVFADDDDKKKDKEPPLPEIVQQIKQSIQTAEANSPQGFDLKLKSLKVDFKTVVKEKVGGGFSIFIFTFGISKEKEAHSLISIKLAVPTPASGIISKIDEEDWKIENAILEAKNAYVAAQGIDPNLTDKSLTMEIGFIVTKGAEAGVSFQILPLAIDLSGSHSKSTEHKLTLEFAAPIQK